MSKLSPRFLLIFASLSLSGCDQGENSNARNSDTLKTSTHQSSAPRNYADARSTLWQELYGNGGESLYCGTEFNYRQNGFNVEHVFPMSWVKNELGCKTRKICRRRDDFNRIEGDLHNLFITESRVNSDRSSVPYGIISGEKWRFKGCDYENNNRVVEPRPQVRGDIARTMFYMSERYSIPLYPRQLSVLKQWHNEDPVSEEEMNRNQEIMIIQGNSNPFIDDPSAADRSF